MSEPEKKMKEISPDDTVQGPRVFTRTTAKFLGIFAAVASLYHLVTAGFGTPEAMIHRAIHLIFIFPLIFAFYSFSRKAPRDRLQWIDIVSIVASWAVCLYVLWEYNRLAWRFPYVDPMTILDQTLAAIAILLVLEATRRTVGWALVTVALIFLGYALLGSYLPGYLAIKGVSPRLLLEESDVTSQFLSDHISNLLPLHGRLPEDRAEMLEQIDRVLESLRSDSALREEWEWRRRLTSL